MRELVEEVPVVGLDGPVLAAVRVMVRFGVPGLVVVDDRDHLVAVLSVAEVLQLVVPPYVGERAAMARVIDEGHADDFLKECAGLSVRDRLPHGQRRTAVAGPDATVLEAAASMISTGCSIVAVVDRDGGVLGAVRWSTLLGRLAA